MTLFLKSIGVVKMSTLEAASADAAAGVQLVGVMKNDDAYERV